MFKLLEKLRSMGPLLALLRDIELEDIDALFAQFKRFMATDDLKTKILAALEVADIAADYTETEMDDEVVEFLELLMTSAAVDILLDLIEGVDSEKAALKVQTMKASSPAGLEVDGKAVPWPLVLQIAVFVIELIKSWKSDEQ